MEGINIIKEYMMSIIISTCPYLMQNIIGDKMMNYYLMQNLNTPENFGLRITQYKLQGWLYTFDSKEITM